MRAPQHRGWLTGLGQACRKPWNHFNRGQHGAGAELAATNAGERPDSVETFLQLLSQSFMQSAVAESSPSSRRPLLANLPAAAELMERATVHGPNPQPVYDLPTFLETSYPQAGVRPRNPGYDWRTWARNHAAPPAQAHPASPHIEERLALLLQMDAHMQLPASRHALVRIAKLELAHLWHHQQQPHQQPRPGGVVAEGGALAPTGGASGVTELREGAVLSAGPSDGGRDDAELTQRRREGESSSGEDVQLAAGAPPPPSGRRAVAQATGGATARAAAAAAVGAEEEDDDIFAAADRKTRAAAAVQQQHQELLQQQPQQQQLQQLAAQAAGSRDPLSSLPSDVQLRLRELQRRAEAYGRMRGGSLPSIVRNVAEAFGQRVSYGKGAYGAGGGIDGGGAEGVMSPATAVQMASSVGAGTTQGLRRRQTATPADLQLMQPGKSVPSPSYWAEHQLLSYGDNVVALAVRQSAARRLEAAGGPDGTSSLAAAVASLSASLPRPAPPRSADPPPPRAACPPPTTPTLSLLLDYLQLKYMDVLHTWEVAARLHEATERMQREAALQRATMMVQAGQLLPAALRDELSASWAQAAASFRPSVLAPLLQPDDAAAAAASGADRAASTPSSSSSSSSSWEAHQRTALQRTLTAPLDWSRAAAMMRGDGDDGRGFLGRAAVAGDLVAGGGGGGAEGAAAAAAASTAAAAGDLRTAVQHALAPVLAAAAVRHRALLADRAKLGGISCGLDRSTTAASVGAGGPGSSSSTFPAAASSSRPASAAAAGVACFRETLVLDASSAFEDSSHDCRVSLEFDVDRLAASEAALGGAWGARLLERLLAPPSPSSPDGPRRHRSAPGGSMAGRARRGAAARSALLARAYPVDVEQRFCRRTRTASLTTTRYPSREANRKLLLEHYSALLRAVAQAAN